MGLGKWLFSKIGNHYTKDIDLDKKSYLCDFGRISHEVIPGDVILVEGANRISRIIKRVSNSPWTHAALYIGRIHSIEDPIIRQLVRKHYHGSAGKQLVVETIVGKGTLIQPLNEYDNHHLRICRPTGLSHTDAQRVIAFAIKHVGHTYNTRHFFDLGRFVLRSHLLPRRWKSSLFKEDSAETTQDICSVMIAKAFTSIKFPILPLIRKDDHQHLEMIHRNPKLYTPSDFDYSPFFSIIKYPIFPLSGHGPYRDLPWHDGLLSHDEGVVTGPVSKDNIDKTNAE